MFTFIVVVNKNDFTQKQLNSVSFGSDFNQYGSLLIGCLILLQLTNRISSLTILKLILFLIFSHIHDGSGARNMTITTIPSYRHASY